MRKIWMGAIALGVGLAISFALDRPDPVELELAELASRILDDVSSDELEAVWECFAENSKTRFRNFHSGFLKWINHYREVAARPEQSRVERLSIQATEREHHMTLEELSKTSARSLWLARIRHVVGSAAAARAYQRHSLEKVQYAGDWATVDMLLADGRHQGFYFVREDGAWKLVDFQAFWPSSRWNVPRLHRSKKLP